MRRRGEEVEFARAYSGERKRFGNRMLCLVIPLFLYPRFPVPTSARVLVHATGTANTNPAFSIVQGPQMNPGPQMLPDSKCSPDWTANDHGAEMIPVLDCK